MLYLYVIYVIYSHMHTFGYIYINTVNLSSCIAAGATKRIEWTPAGSNWSTARGHIDYFTVCGKEGWNHVGGPAPSNIPLTPLAPP